MSVYVDPPVWPFGRMLMCHLTADSLDELHGMADRIGVARKWFQSKTRYPHYDICKSKRALAVQAGAIEVSSKELVLVAKRLRACLIDRDGQPEALKLPAEGMG
ncbi:MAG: DUF4031 domain-containing protein [Nevskiaceae bacterium]|nr:MAG: DUF4031 domain-containing protein [Nevskiaceae bacterium]